MVGEAAVVVASDGQPGLVDPGGQALRRAAEMPDGSLSDHRSRAGLAPHRPDPRAARDDHQPTDRALLAALSRLPRRAPPMLISQVLVHAGQQARALGSAVIDPELLLLGVVTDIQTSWPRCMNNRWRRQLYASVGLPKGYRGAAGPLVAALGIDLDQLREAVTVELGGVQR
jgi:hypothetical protein